MMRASSIKEEIWPAHAFLTFVAFLVFLTFSFLALFSLDGFTRGDASLIFVF